MSLLPRISSSPHSWSHGWDPCDDGDGRSWSIDWLGIHLTIVAGTTHDPIDRARRWWLRLGILTGALIVGALVALVGL